MGFFEKLKQGMTKTRDNLSGKISDLMSSFKKVDEDFLEELEETLILCDVGVATTMKIMEALRAKIKEEKISETSQVKQVLIQIVEELITPPEANITYPCVILVVGVNGVGKTTTIGKLASKYVAEGKKVLLAAADTFRAAAADQLTIWSERAGVPIVKYAEGADPAAVVYDALDSAKHKKMDVVICDTAGRLHNKVNLMNEINKIKRVIEKEWADAHKEVYLVLDATTGQNAVEQAKVFQQTTDITGIILTKLDGTAKGGVVLAVKEELGVPVRYIGVGEQVDDLQEFNPKDFARALLE